MAINKSKLRLTLTDEHLKTIIRKHSNQLVPNVSDIIKNKQLH